ncbi:MAG: 16S rRNA (cytosine(1402)-N(4))-methyltransferase [Candidatus Sungbacteria bacterium RIFCSPLOWO2_02_FULL_54_10]|nr:MAG: 16S rRNA (cytosine(1402)-N(4))-methyltransferase [Candidatus Sungbacteria bacterium RIFCSPHIGHO2_01_FULL_54_26]OHA12435.1 MAG: 16S rRNA (cytosine(1402)-N(4))-methyltransferase [Candidatus Sungbacteria bacterium RIFCSPLOWO2_02_FULL_54_10]
MHEPVLLKEVLDIFNPRPGQTYIDATINGGGHARAIAERVGKNRRVIGMDWDCDIISEARKRNAERGIKNIDLVCETYRKIQDVARERGITDVDGVLFDLGFSSYHTDQSGRGFAFSKDEPLDMRYHPERDRKTAADIINTYPEKELSDMFMRYGEERFARRIARRIAEERRKKRIVSTKHLADIVWHGIPPPARNGRIHPATRVFQALRIAVNDELASVPLGLTAAASLLAPGGTIAVIAFHSLEDRIVKDFMKQQHTSGILRILTPKPVRPQPEEIHHNPRARSAMLRAATKN